MHARFTAILNEIYSFGEIIPTDKAIRKQLSMLLELCKSKVKAIIEVRDLDTMPMDKLIRNLTT